MEFYPEVVWRRGVTYTWTVWNTLILSWKLWVLPIHRHYLYSSNYGSFKIFSQHLTPPPVSATVPGWQRPVCRCLPWVPPRRPGASAAWAAGSSALCTTRLSPSGTSLWSSPTAAKGHPRFSKWNHRCEFIFSPPCWGTDVFEGPQQDCCTPQPTQLVTLPPLPRQKLCQTVAGEFKSGRITSFVWFDSHLVCISVELLVRLGGEKLVVSFLTFPLHLLPSSDHFIPPVVDPKDRETKESWGCFLSNFPPWYLSFRKRSLLKSTLNLSRKSKPKVLQQTETTVSLLKN